MTDENKWQDTQADIWKFEDEGKNTLEGTYVAAKDGKYSRNDANGNQIGKSQIYTIRDSNNVNHTVFGTTILERRMADVPLNSLVKIQYLGMIKNKRDQDTKDFKVFVAKE